MNDKETAANVTDDQLETSGHDLVAPGEILKEELEARGWSQRDLADIMGRPVQAISEIMNATKQITPQTAIELGSALGTSAELWTNLEAGYRLALARAESPNDAIAERARLFSLVPVPELRKRGWIQGGADTAREICQFLGLDSIWDEPTVHASYRASTARGPEQPAVVAWLRRTEILASHQDLPPYDRDRLTDRLGDLADLSLDPAGVASVGPTLAEAGVHFLVVPHLPKSYLDGAQFWLDERPVVALTGRYDRIDSFWFTLFHEIGHVWHGHEGAAEIVLDDRTTPSGPEEEAANDFAREYLLPAERWKVYAEELSFAPRLHRVEEAAEVMHRHPGVLVGQLQHQGALGYGQGRNHLVKVKPYLEDIIDSPLASEGVKPR